MEEHVGDVKRPLTERHETLAAPTIFAYASHLPLLHRVTERSIEVLQRAFPHRFSPERDRPVLEARASDAAGLLAPFVAAGYLEPAPEAVAGVASWVVPDAVRDLLTGELRRFHGPARPAAGAEGAQGDRCAADREQLIAALRGLAADTAEDELLLGELAVQVRAVGDWDRLEELWYRWGMRMIVIDPVATFAAFGAIPEPECSPRPGLRFAAAYAESVAEMHRHLLAPDGEDRDATVDRLSVRLTEVTSALGPRWRELDSSDGRLHVGITWMRFQRLRGDFDGAIATMGELERSLAAEASVREPASDRNRAFFRLEQGILLFFLDRWAEAKEVLREAVLLWQRPGRGDYVPAYALALTALMSALQGSRARAVESLARAQGIFGEVRNLSYVTVLTTSVEALLAVDRLDIDRAQRHIRRLDGVAEESELWPLVMQLRQWIDVLAGDAAASVSEQGRLLAAATGAGRLSPLARRLVSRARVEGLLSLGQAQRARAHLERSPALSSSAAHVCWARLSLMAGRDDQVLRHVDIVLHDARAAHRDRAAALLCAAAVNLRAGRAEGVDRACIEAVSELRRAGSLVPLAVAARAERDALVDRCAVSPEWPALLAALEVTDEDVVERIADVAGGFPAHAPLIDLTARERELLVLLDARLTQPEMARRLHLSLSTVKKQVAGLYRKLGVESQAAALERAYLLGLFDGGSERPERPARG